MMQPNRKPFSIAKENFFLLSVICFFCVNQAIFSQIRIKAVGDIMLGSITPTKIIPGDGGKCFVNSIGKYLKDGDILFGNLEGALIEEGMKADKCSDSSRAKGVCYEFGMPSNIAGSLKEMGFTILNLDNNHSLDYGNEGYENTKKKLASLGISYCPPKGHSYYLIKGKRIAVAAFGFENYSNEIFDLETVKAVISKLKASHDIVIASFHSGAEGKNASHTSNKTEIFLGENRGNVVQFAHTAVDAGASMVIGHGPHVLRAVELYKNKLIAYSLGNFLTYGNFNISGLNGSSVILDCVIDQNTGNFIKGSLIPVEQHKPGIPCFDEEKSGIKQIIKLSEEDFPEQDLIIDEKGNLSIKFGKK